MFLLYLYLIISGIMYIKTDHHDYGKEALSSPDGYIFIILGIVLFVLDFFLL